MRTRLLLLGSALLVLTSCQPETPAPVGPGGIQADVTGGPYPLSGAITGPGGVSICSVVSGAVRVTLVAVGRGTVATRSMCPASNSYLFSVAPGTYFVQVGPTSFSLGTLPWRYMDPTPVVLDGPAVRDVQVEAGSTLGGGATLDGSPVAGVLLSAIYDLVPGYTAASLASNAAGAWTESFIGRTPPILQNGLAYRFIGCDGPLAADVVTGPPPGAVVFPTAISSVQCAFATNSATERTHFSGRLAVTADAGEFGAQDPPHVARRGRGWGVQFPLGPSGPLHLPQNATQLYTGGLILGFAPDKVLSAVELYDPCPTTCMDFDLSGAPAITTGSSGKVVTWRYSDAPSPEREGVEVTQRSYDGDGDYVLFQFIIRNASGQPKTFWAGTFMDWDLDLDATDDGVETGLDGRLMFGYSGMTYTFPAPAGNHLGSMLLGQPVSGNYAQVCCPDLTPAQQVAALSGAVRVPSDTRTFLDKRYYHGAGPITLFPGQRTDLWVPIVAGTDRAGLFAAAAAAEADWQRRGQRLTVGIDIQPGNATNQVNLKGTGMLPVAILGSASFDVGKIDAGTIVFGTAGAVPVHDLTDPGVLASHLLDVNGDGYIDLITHYRVAATGFTAGTTQGCVNGITTAGIVFNGCDAVKVK